MKIDLHCHTFFSEDGISSIENIIKQGKRKKIDGVAITDHENIDAWEEAVFWGKKYKFEIILGEEIKSSQGDILGLFMKEKINGKGKDPRFVMEEIKKQGGLVFIPHPFHKIEGFDKSLEQYLDIIDGIEVFNGRRPFYRGDKLAKEFAEKHNLIKIGGSDSHYYKTVGNTFTECEAKTIQEFRIELLKNKTIVVGKKSSLKYFIFPLMKKMGILRKPI
ncbi:MAG: PHP domain-containing protein [Candidatus Paceibacterota bacterium]